MKPTGLIEFSAMNTFTTFQISLQNIKFLNYNFLKQIHSIYCSKIKIRLTVYIRSKMPLAFIDYHSYNLRNISANII